MAREFDYLQPNEPRWGRLNPVDPSVDTFRQRWAPFSSDPVGDYIEEQQRMPPPRIAPPGTRERYGDPTKVLSMAGAVLQKVTRNNHMQFRKDLSLTRLHRARYQKALSLMNQWSQRRLLQSRPSPPRSRERHCPRTQPSRPGRSRPLLPRAGLEDARRGQ